MRDIGKNIRDLRQQKHLTQEELAERIMKEMKRGATGISARGMYSGNQKEILFCVVSKKEIVQLKELVVGHDSQAFVIVSDAREVLGEGFIEFRQ